MNRKASPAAQLRKLMKASDEQVLKMHRQLCEEHGLPVHDTKLPEPGTKMISFLDFCKRRNA